VATAVVSATLVAVTVTLVEELTDGAVNRPTVEIVPALTCQVTAVLLVEVIVAVNCCFVPEETVAVAGERLIATLVDGTIVTSAAASPPSSMALVAVTVTTVDEVTVGAVNTPLLETVPAVACQMICELPDSTPTFVLSGDVTVALNCCWAPEEIVILAGERLILAFELEELLVEFVGDVGRPEQASESHANVVRRIVVPTCQTRVAVALPRW
jgi:hypothetical protein